MFTAYVFTSANCAPCKALKEELETHPLDNVNVEMLDMSNPSDYTLDLATKYRIRSAPTIVVDASYDDKSKALGNFYTFKNLQELKQKLMS